MLVYYENFLESSYFLLLYIKYIYSLNRIFFIKKQIIKTKLNLGGYEMKFVKGILVGSMLTAGIAMVYADNMGLSKNKMTKKGKKLAKKIGMM